MRNDPDDVPMSIELNDSFGVDYSERFAIVGLLLPDRSASPELRSNIYRVGNSFAEAFRDAAQDSVREVLGADYRPFQQPIRYSIGPQAEQFPTFVVSIWDTIESIDPVISRIADAWAVFEIVSRVRKQIQNWAKWTGGVEAAVILPPYVLQMLCEAHVRHNYHPRAKLSSEWRVTELRWPDYGSARYPTGMEQLLIMVRARRNRYFYDVDTRGRVRSHYMEVSNGVESFPPPSLFGDSSPSSNSRNT